MRACKSWGSHDYAFADKILDDVLSAIIFLVNLELIHTKVDYVVRMHAARYTSHTASSSESTQTRASILVHRVRSLSDEQIAQELRDRRNASFEERMQTATHVRKERARLAAARLRAL